MKTAQEVYDQVRLHLLTQLRKSQVGVSCKYRGPDGAKCAVGCLIPDELYDPAFEGCVPHEERTIRGSPNYDVRNLLCQRLVASGVGEDLFPLLRSLQKVHDSSDPADWPKKLAGVARQYGLEVRQ